MGSVVTADEVMQVIKRDAVFYRESGGGVTFSGGEPFLQAEFLRELVAACRRQGIDTAVETCGHYDWEPVKDIFAQLDSVFVDIKHMDDAAHRRLTGVARARRARLTRSFNNGYRSYSRTYSSCTSPAQTAITRFLAEGAELADAMTKSAP